MGSFYVSRTKKGGCRNLSRHFGFQIDSFHTYGAHTISFRIWQWFLIRYPCPVLTAGCLRFLLSMPPAINSGWHHAGFRIVCHPMMPPLPAAALFWRCRHFLRWRSFFAWRKWSLRFRWWLFWHSSLVPSFTLLLLLIRHTDT
jgi:hypothetical protein